MVGRLPVAVVAAVVDCPNGSPPSLCRAALALATVSTVAESHFVSHGTLAARGRPSSSSRSNAAHCLMASQLFGTCHAFSMSQKLVGSRMSKIAIAPLQANATASSARMRASLTTANDRPSPAWKLFAKRSVHTWHARPLLPEASEQTSVFVRGRLHEPPAMCGLDVLWLLRMLRQGNPGDLCISKYDIIMRHRPSEDCQRPVPSGDVHWPHEERSGKSGGGPAMMTRRAWEERGCQQER